MEHPFVVLRHRVLDFVAQLPAQTSDAFDRRGAFAVDLPVQATFGVKADAQSARLAQNLFAIRPNRPSDFISNRGIPDVSEVLLKLAADLVDRAAPSERNHSRAVARQPRTPKRATA